MFKSTVFPLRKELEDEELDVEMVLSPAINNCLLLELVTYGIPELVLKFPV